MNEAYHISEHGIIRKSSEYSNAVSNIEELYLPDKDFNSICNFVLSNQPSDGDIPFSLFSKNRKLQIKVRNFVGIIETQDGISLEILPKIYSESSNELQNARGAFLKMIKCLKNSPFVNLSSAHLNPKKDFPILEVFISSYIDEVKKILNRGIKSDYILTRDNLKYIRGKIVISENRRINLHNKAHIFCEFNELSENIPQNRIIKTTIIKLSQTTRNNNNYSSLMKLLSHFKNVKMSFSVKKDLDTSFASDRLFSHYKQLLEWSKLFLMNMGLTQFHGNSLNTALLFPMEKVFESYVAFLFKKYTSALKISAQDKSFFLVEKHLDTARFRLRPDLYIEKSDIQRIIIDTKWKLIDESQYKHNYDIKISDMYQMYAYGKKYSTAESIPELAVIYPKNERFTNKLDSFMYETGLNLTVIPFDFDKDEEQQITGIVDSLSREIA